MPVFDAADAHNPPLHMQGWDDDELVYLRPHLTYLMEQRASGKALLLPDDLSRDQLRAMPQEEVERILVASRDTARVDEQLLVDMIERWTLRRQPTRAQREAGERGDVMPLSREAIAQLPPEVGEYIRAEIDKRRDVVAPDALATAEVEAEGTDFRGAVPAPARRLDAEPREPVSPTHTGRGGNRGEDRVDARPDRRLSRGAS